MSYRVDYVLADNKKGTVIHRFTTKREAAAFAKWHMKACNHALREAPKMTRVSVCHDKNPPDMGWLHGRLVHLYPMEF